MQYGELEKLQLTQESLHLKHQMDNEPPNKHDYKKLCQPKKSNKTNAFRLRNNPKSPAVANELAA